MKKDMLKFWIASAAAGLVLALLLMALEGCRGTGPTPTATTSPVSPIPTPAPSPTVLMGSRLTSRVAGRAAAPQAAPQAVAGIYTGTSYLNWDDPTVANGWVAVWADVPLAYTFVHLWRVVDGDTIIAQGPTSNDLASHLPTNGPGTGRFNGPLAWTMDLGLFEGRAHLWEKGCWEAVSCPLTATVVLSYPTYSEEVVGCPDVCMVNVPDPGIPLMQSEDGYWLTGYIVATGILPYQEFLPLVLSR